jgi:hypothetical protein
MKFKKFHVVNFDEDYDEDSDESDEEDITPDEKLARFIAEDKRTIRIRQILRMDEELIVIFYDDILPGTPTIERTGDRFSDLEV